MKFFSEMLLSPEYITRPVNARWERVLDLDARGKRRATHKWDDAAVQRGLDFARRIRDCHGVLARERLSLAMPDVDAAYRLHWEASELDRGIVQARLLAGQPFEAVAAACGMATEGVRAYHDLFFDVQSRLRDKFYITTRAVGWKPGRDTAGEGLDMLLRYVGYYAGPQSLDLLIRYLRYGLPIPERLESATEEELEELAGRLEAKFAVEAFVRPLQDCSRALRLRVLALDLRTYLLSLTVENVKASLAAGLPGTLAQRPADAAGVTVAAGGGAPGSPATDVEEWWAAWREAAMAG